MTSAPGPVLRFLSRLFGVEADEAPAVMAGVLMFFLLFAGYFMLRPVRETMGIAGGVDNLQWLFTGTFIATLAAIPLFGWVAGARGAAAHPALDLRLLRAEPAGFRGGHRGAAGQSPGSRAGSTSGCRCSACSACRWPGAYWPICFRCCRPNDCSAWSPRA
ncbi:hypothetical protein [Arenimonas daejeonensis]|uniref:hypothetical protein n=1 Tax=Arenimonas daejeonensis TaxID=370777 RepID=UPI001D1480BB|nr:hypothetical protein [Arenimonas daejeonensis]